MDAINQIPPVMLPHAYDLHAKFIPHRRGDEVAQEWEATMLSLLLKEMRQTLDPETLFPGDAGDIHGGLFDFYLGRLLAASGGIGLAELLKRHLQPESFTSPNTSTNYYAPESRNHPTV